MNIAKFTKVARKTLSLRYCGAVIVAAGSASRMGGIDKVMATVAGEPMIVKTARAFQQCDAIREIVIVTRQDLLVPIMDLCHDFHKVKLVITGICFFSVIYFLLESVKNYQYYVLKILKCIMDSNNYFRDLLKHCQRSAFLPF